MYSENLAVNTEQANSRPALSNILERFEKQNAWQTEGLGMIESKLHNILNKRTPEKEPGRKDEISPAIGDANQAILQQLAIMERNCQKIESLTKHLIEIAG